MDHKFSTTIIILVVLIIVFLLIKMFSKSVYFYDEAGAGFIVITNKPSFAKCIHLKDSKLYNILDKRIFTDENILNIKYLVLYVFSDGSEIEEIYHWITIEYFSIIFFLLIASLLIFIVTRNIISLKKRLIR